MHSLALGRTHYVPKTFKNEKAFQNWLLKELAAMRGVWAYAPPTLARRGIPDVIVCANGYFVALELKLDASRPDPTREKLQEYTIGKIRDAGSKLALTRVTPNTWPQVRQELELMLAAF